MFSNGSRVELYPDCPVCYDLVKGAVRTLRQKLDALKNVITDIETVPRSSINDTDFLDKLYAVNSTVYQLWLDATSDGTINKYDSNHELYVGSELCIDRKFLRSLCVYFYSAIV